MVKQFVVSNISFERNGQTLFTDINCILHPGDCLEIRGANGSGKSTLLRILAKLITPQTGKITWQGHMHYIGHLSGIKPYLTVTENLRLISALNLHKTQVDVLAKLGLATHAQTQAQYLSAGQLRRLSLARLLMQPATLWLLDEPLTALDTQGQDLFNQLLAEHLVKGGIALIATHQTLNSATQKLVLGEAHA